MSERNRKLDELNDWLQVVATVGVIASIIFLGLELRQNSDLMRAQIYQARAEIIQETFMTMQESEYLVPIQVKMGEANAQGKSLAENVAALTAEEKVRMGYYLERQIRHLDNMYYQNELGLLDDEYMAWWENIVKNNVELWFEVLDGDIPGRESFVGEVQRIHNELQ